jgi:hypothetical protein
VLLINKSGTNLKKGQKMKAQKCMIDKQLTTESVQILGKHFLPSSSIMMVLPCLTKRTANAFCNAAVKPGLTQTQISIVRVKYVRIAVKITTDTVYLF